MPIDPHDIAGIQRSHEERLRATTRWVIAETEAGFEVHEWTADSVSPWDIRETREAAASRLLTLMGIGHAIIPQNYPERVCVGNVMVMHCQLKQTAFFVADSAGKPNRHLGRHYKAPDGQCPLPDVDRRVVVGWRSNATADALEFIPARPVPFVDQVTARTLPARVAWIDQIDRNSPQARLVLNQAAQFVEAPVVQSSPLAPVGLDPIPDAFEVFEGNRASAAFGVENDCFAQNVVCVALETRLLAGSAPERTLRGTGADLLQGAAAGVLAAAHVVDLRAGKGAAQIVHREVDYAKIDTANVSRNVGRNFLNIACRREHPLAANEHQINLTLGAGEQSAVGFGADERNALAAGKRPDRDGVLTWQKAENAFVIGLRGVAPELANFLFVANLEGVGNLSDAPRGDLSGKSKAGAQFSVSDLVQIVLPRGLRVRAKPRQPIASRVAPLKRGMQKTGLFWCRKQPNGGDQLHRSGALLRFDVASHDGLGHGANRTGIVATAPKRRQAGTQRRELLAENTAGTAFDPVDDLSHAQRRVRLDKQMHVVGHYLHRVDGYAMLLGGLNYQFLEPGINRSDEHLTPVFRAPDEVVLQAENRSGAGSVSWFGGHSAYYTGARYIAIGSVASVARPAIPPPPEGSGFSRRPL